MPPSSALLPPRNSLFLAHAAQRVFLRLVRRTTRELGFLVRQAGRGPQALGEPSCVIAAAGAPGSGDTVTGSGGAVLMCAVGLKCLAQ